MGLKAETLTLIPALILFLITIYLSILTIQVIEDWKLKQQLNLYSLITFNIGISLAICWLVYWGICRKIIGKI